MIHYNRINNYIFSRIKDHHLANDLTQETFVKYLEHKDNITDELPWLYKVAKNFIRAHKKYWFNKQRRNLDLDMFVVPYDPLEKMIKDEDLKKLKDFIESKRKKDKNLLKLKLTGLTNKEIAKRLYTTKYSIDMRLKRARELRNPKTNNKGVRFKVKNEWLTLSELSKKYKICRGTAQRRMQLGWTIEKVFLTPVNHKFRRKAS